MTLLLIVGSIVLAVPTAALAQGTCWLAEDQFVDTQVGDGEEPGYVVSVEGRDYERCWGNVRLLTPPGEAFSGYTKVFYSDELEPLMLMPDTARAFGCPYGLDDEVDMVASGPDWNAVEQTGDGWVPAKIAAAEKSCRYDVVAHVGGVPKTFNPLHDQLRPAQLPRLTTEQVAEQSRAMVDATTCVGGGTAADYPGDSREAMTQRGAVTEILRAFPDASVYLGTPAIGIPATATAGSAFEALHPMAMPDADIYPVRVDALICTPATPHKSEQRWAFELSCYLDRFETFACDNRGGTLVN